MSHLAGAEPPLDQIRPRRAGPTWWLSKPGSAQRPRPHTVHVLDPESGRSTCEAFTAAALVPLELGWEFWAVLYRCRGCHGLVPELAQ